MAEIANFTLVFILPLFHCKKKILILSSEFSILFA